MLSIKKIPLLCLMLFFVGNVIEVLRKLQLLQCFLIDSDSRYSWLFEVASQSGAAFISK